MEQGLLFLGGSNLSPVNDRPAFVIFQRLETEDVQTIPETVDKLHDSQEPVTSGVFVV